MLPSTLRWVVARQLTFLLRWKQSCFWHFTHNLQVASVDLQDEKLIDVPVGNPASDLVFFFDWGLAEKPEMGLFLYSATGLFIEPGSEKPLRTLWTTFQTKTIKHTFALRQIYIENAKDTTYLLQNSIGEAQSIAARCRAGRFTVVEALLMLQRHRFIPPSCPMSLY